MVEYIIERTNEFCPECRANSKTSLLRRVEEVHGSAFPEDGDEILKVVSKRCFDGYCSYEIVLKDEWIGRRTPYQKPRNEQTKLNILIAEEANADARKTCF